MSRWLLHTESPNRLSSVTPFGIAMWQIIRWMLPDKRSPKRRIRTESKSTSHKQTNKQTNKRIKRPTNQMSKRMNEWAQWHSNVLRMTMMVMISMTTVNVMMRWYCCLCRSINLLDTHSHSLYPGPTMFETFGRQLTDFCAMIRWMVFAQCTYIRIISLFLSMHANLSYLQISGTAFKCTTFVCLCKFKPPKYLYQTIDTAATHQLCPCF